MAQLINQPSDQKLDPQPLTEWLGSTPLQYLVAKARQIARADEVLHGLLTRELALHCRVMNLSANVLVVEVDSAAWATRLRYLVPELVADFKRHELLKEVTDIRCKVRF